MAARKKNRRAKKQQPVKANIYLPECVLLTLASFLDPSSFLAFARTCRHHLLLSRQIHPTFFAESLSLLSLPDKVLHLLCEDLERPENRSLALTCRRLLPIARAHTWFTVGASAGRRTTAMLDLLAKKEFDGDLLHRLAFDAMDEARYEAPPSPEEFAAFGELLPYLPNLGKLAIYTLPRPSKPALQGSLVTSLSTLQNLVELELGGWDEYAEEPHSNPPLLLNLLLDLLPHLHVLRKLEVVLQGCDPKASPPTLPNFLCPATQVSIGIFAPFTSHDLSLLAPSVFFNAKTLTIGIDGPSHTLTTPDLVSAFSFLSPHLLSLSYTGIHFPTTFLDTLLPRFPLLNKLSLQSTSVSPTFVRHLPPLLELIMLDHLFEDFEESPMEPTFLSAFLGELSRERGFVKELSGLMIFCRKADEWRVRRVVERVRGRRTFVLRTFTSAE